MPAHHILPDIHFAFPSNSNFLRAGAPVPAQTKNLVFLQSHIPHRASGSVLAMDTLRT